MFDLSLFETKEKVIAAVGESEEVVRTSQMKELLTEYPKRCLYDDISYEDIKYLAYNFSSAIELLIMRGNIVKTLANVAEEKSVKKKKYLL